MKQLPHAVRSRTLGYLEPLEPRRLLATIEWIGGAAGDWSDASNWSAGVPGIDDDVQITGGAIHPVVAITTPIPPIKSLQCDNSTVRLTTGMLNIALGGSVLNGSSIELGDATLSTSGQLLIAASQFIWTGGSVAGSGPLLIAGDTPAGLGTMEIIGPDSKTLSTIVQNDGTTKWGGGTIIVDFGSVRNNGQFIALPGLMTGTALATFNRFENHGSFGQEGEGEIIFDGIDFVNTGNIHAAANIVIQDYSIRAPAFTMSGGTLDGDLLVRGAAASLNWDGGVMSGFGTTTVDDDARTRIRGTETKYLRRTIRNAGRDIYWAGGDIVLLEGKFEQISPGRHFFVSAAGSIRDGGSVAPLLDLTGITVYLEESAHAVFEVPLKMGSIFGQGSLRVRAGGEIRDFRARDAFFEGGITTVLSSGGADTLQVVNGAHLAFIGESAYYSSHDGTAEVVGDGSLLQLGGGDHGLDSLTVGPGASTRMSGMFDSILRVQSLSVVGNAVLDIGRGSIIVDYQSSTPLPTIRSALSTGYNSGLWNGPGISSSFAAANSGYAVGYAEASHIFSSFPATFMSQQVDDTSVLITRTRYGDANLDRVVNLQDFNRLAANFGSGVLWSEGNFNYDNFVNLQDFNRLAGQFGQSAYAREDDEKAIVVDLLRAVE